MPYRSKPRSDLHEIAAATGRAVALERGQAIRLVNTHGGQVVDTWAVMRADPTEMMSMAHTRRMNGHLHAVEGDRLWSDRRTPMLVLEEDRGTGMHDTLLASCDPWLYGLLGCEPGHANCRDNFLTALVEHGVEATRVPDPLNLWMSVPVRGDVAIIEPPTSKPGDYVVLRALEDCHVVFSTCPMDVEPAAGAGPTAGGVMSNAVGAGPTNGDLTPRPVHYEVLAS